MTPRLYPHLLGWSAFHVSPPSLAGVLCSCGSICPCRLLVSLFGCSGSFSHCIITGPYPGPGKGPTAPKPFSGRLLAWVTPPHFDTLAPGDAIQNGSPTQGRPAVCWPAPAGCELCAAGALLLAEDWLTRSEST